MANSQDPIYPFNADANGNPIQNLYGFGSPSLVSRLRRVEKAVPYDRSGNQVFSSSAVQGVATSALSNGQVNLASSAVQKVGSVAPNGVSGNFGATATANSITWYWDGTNSSSPLVIHRADGSTFSVPPGSITISGLSPSTTYYFLPFWNTITACQVSWVLGTVGLPKIAFVSADTTSDSTQFYLAQQVQQAREQLTNGFMSFPTPASGSSGGTGGGGGSTGSCVMTGTDIDPIGDYGSMSKEILGQFQWTGIQTDNLRSLNGTPDHPVYACTSDNLAAMQAAMQTLTEESMAPFLIQLQYVGTGMYIAAAEGTEKITSVRQFNRTCSKICVHMERGHLFYANGILSHNKAANIP